MDPGVKFILIILQLFKMCFFFLQNLHWWIIFLHNGDSGDSFVRTITLKIQHWVGFEFKTLTDTQLGAQGCENVYYNLECIDFDKHYKIYQSRFAEVLKF